MFILEMDLNDPGEGKSPLLGPHDSWLDFKGEPRWDIWNVTDDLLISYIPSQSSIVCLQEDNLKIFAPMMSGIASVTLLPKQGVTAAFNDTEFPITQVYVESTPSKQLSIISQQGVENDVSWGTIYHNPRSVLRNANRYKAAIYDLIIDPVLLENNVFVAYNTRNEFCIIATDQDTYLLVGNQYKMPMIEYICQLYGIMIPNNPQIIIVD